MLSSQDHLKLMYCAHNCVGAVPFQGAGSQGRVCHVHCELNLDSLSQRSTPHTDGASGQSLLSAPLCLDHLLLSFISVPSFAPVC